MATFEYDAVTARELGRLAQRASAEDESLELPGVCWLEHVRTRPASRLRTISGRLAARRTGPPLRSPGSASAVRTRTR
jgi:hypothetical protein